ncbi:diguanylate cyclase [Marinimicrobium alkaliphilum]|uniref:diguanylate cyclase n=1 Tax=Marinimicrobium alkaliphilum TaxID=2202654 RepID=UPI000DB991FA|nr:diguanylate cyclase [Marinimicrobium alkaliphilum]
MNILLVEDSATLRHAMSRYMTDAGHRVVVAQTGEAALQLLEDTSVDMIIMDVELPGLNGFETTRLIREWLGDHWIPIIFVTGRNEDESYREGIEAGGDDYLIKPISQTILQAKIQAMARITEMRDQLKQLNTELAALSERDSLTQVLNRRTFNERADRLWAQAERQQTALSVLMIDVDHFKLYNDHYGHPAGDRCLKQVCDAISACLQRPLDLVGRYGGEEFIVVLPETGRSGANEVATSINQAVAALAVRHEVSPTCPVVTVSIGGACCESTGRHSLEDLIKHADRALYKTKHAGRNHAQVDDVETHKTLLIVDSDHERLQSSVDAMQSHCNILTSDRADECLEMALDASPDLIILESRLANQFSNKLQLQLAQNPKTARIPLLLIADSLALPREVNTDMVRDYLDAPFTPGTLVGKVQELLN